MSRWAERTFAEGSEENEESCESRIFVINFGAAGAAKDVPKGLMMADDGDDVHACHASQRCTRMDQWIIGCPKASLDGSDLA